MKFGQYMSYYKNKSFIKKSSKNVTWKLVPAISYVMQIEKALKNDRVRVSKVS